MSVLKDLILVSYSFALRDPSPQHPTKFTILRGTPTRLFLGMTVLYSMRNSECGSESNAEFGMRNAEPYLMRNAEFGMRNCSPSSSRGTRGISSLSVRQQREITPFPRMASSEGGKGARFFERNEKNGGFSKSTIPASALVLPLAAIKPPLPVRFAR